MAQNSGQFFEFADLGAYTVRERLLIRLADLVFTAAIYVVGFACRSDDSPPDAVRKLSDEGRAPIFAVWHEHIFTGSYIWRRRRIVAMASRSFDGEYISRCMMRLGFGIVRGSTTRGGQRALIQLKNAVRAGFATLLTVDGPKGPRNVAQSGVCTLAKKTGNPIVPVAFESTRFRRVPSWDGHRIPKLFSRVRVLYGEPIWVGADDDLEAKREEVQKALDELNALGKAWSDSV